MEIDLNKWFRCEIDKQELKRLCKKSDWQGFKHMFIYFFFLFLFGYLAYATWGTWWTILFFFIYGNIWGCSDAVWHETGHRTAFKSKFWNDFFYYIASFMDNFEPIRWRYSHFHHHTYTIFNDHVFIWCVTIFFSLLYQTWLPLLFIILPNFYGKTLVMLMGLTQHAGLQEDIKDHRYTTRTVYLNPILSFLYWHMEYHIEHHIFPTVPSYNLPKIHELIKDQLPTTRKGLWGAYKEILPALIKQAKDPNYKIPLAVPT